jgi:hypothetical protein
MRVRKLPSGLAIQIPPLPSKTTYGPLGFKLVGAGVNVDGAGGSGVSEMIGMIVTDAPGVEVPSKVNILHDNESIKTRAGMVILGCLCMTASL